MFAKTLAAMSAAAVLLVASVAHADEPSSEWTPEATEAAARPVPPPTESSWYGYQTLSTDAAAIALVAIGATSDSTPVKGATGVMGVATYAIAPAVIHGVHGHAGKAVGDVAIRIFTPLVGIGVGALAGAAMFEPSRDPGLTGVITNTFGKEVAILEGAAIGGFIGIGTAIAIDAAALGWETVPAQKKEAPRPIASAKPAGPTFHPSGGPTRDGFVAGVGGTF